MHTTEALQWFVMAALVMDLVGKSSVFGTARRLVIHENFRTIKERRSSVIVRLLNGFKSIQLSSKKAALG